MGYFQILHPIICNNINTFKDYKFKTKEITNKDVNGRIYKIKFRTCKHMCGTNTLNLKQDLWSPNHHKEKL